jgi:hypothetical protein
MRVWTFGRFGGFGGFVAVGGVGGVGEADEICGRIGIYRARYGGRSPSPIVSSQPQILWSSLHHKL